jgi:hypothetical protein
MEYVGSDRILTMIRDFPHEKSFQVRSTNLGDSWPELTDVTTPTVGIAARQRVYTRAHLKGEDNWWEDNVLFMVGFIQTDPGSSQGRRNCIWISGDFGDTWTTPFYVDTETEDGGYGDMFYDADEDQYVVVSNYGTLAAASLKQYRLTVTGLG